MEVFFWVVMIIVYVAASMVKQKRAREQRQKQQQRAEQQQPAAQKLPQTSVVPESVEPKPKKQTVSPEEEMLRRFFGLPVEEELQAAPKEPPMPVRPAIKTASTEHTHRVIRAVSERDALPVRMKKRSEPVAEVPIPNPIIPEKRLFDGPQAARKAFILSEIFGRPRADRQHGMEM